MKPIIIRYDKKQSFWNDAPIQTIFNTFMASIPFLKKIEPSLIPSGPQMDPTYKEEYENALYLEKNGDEYYSVKKLHPDSVLEYSDFIATYFYESSLKTQKKYELGFLSKMIENGSIYGAEIRSKEQLIGVILGKNLGPIWFTASNPSRHSSCIVTELCVHPKYRKQGISNLLLRRLYQYSFQKQIAIHFFQIDAGKLFPSFPILNTYPVYGRRGASLRNNTEEWNIVKKEIDVKTLNNIRNSIYFKDKSAITCLNKISDDIVLYESSYASVILRNLYELDENRKEGAEVLYAQSYVSDDPSYIEKLLDFLHYSWYESRTPFVSSQWERKGFTSTFAFHLNYGRPSFHGFHYF